MKATIRQHRSIWTRWIDLGITSDQTKEEKWMIHFTNLISVTGVPMVGAYMLLFQILDAELFQDVIRHNFICLPFYLSTLVWSALRLPRLAMLHLGLTGLYQLGVVTMYLGASSGNSAFILGGSVFLFFVIPKTEQVFRVALCGFGVAVFTWVTLAYPETAISSQLSPQIINLMLFANIAGATFLNAYLAVLFQSFLLKSEKELALAHKQSEELLLNILPPSIARHLKIDEQTAHKEGVLAEYHEQVTVLFADLVGFTEHSSKLPPGELVFQLNELFSRFDDMTIRIGVEKIKTIGDAYMLICGAPVPDGKHAQKVVMAGLEMIELVDRFNNDYGLGFQVRIGIHSGPVVAGVIGKRKFSYDLWGDTVNLASRMESSGVPGSIQVTQATYEILKGQYSFKERANLEIKGKGQMSGFLIEREQ